MSNQRPTKFLDPIRSIADLSGLEAMRQAVNSLLNAKVVNGAVNGFIPADGNVIYQIAQPQNTFRPFQIYKPDLANLLEVGATFLFTGELLGGIAIDSTQPTSLDGDGNFQSVNPITDGWRIFAIRTGFITARTGEALANGQDFNLGISQVSYVAPDLATGIEVLGCDGFGMGVNAEFYNFNDLGYPREFNTENTPDFSAASVFKRVIPFIIPPTWNQRDATQAFFLLIGVDSNGIYPAINGFVQTLPDEPAPGIGFTVPETSLTGYPLGVISYQGVGQYQNPPTTTIYQVQYGNIELGYGRYMNSWIEQEFADPLTYSATLNYRGHWQNDPITGRLFYPGDVIVYQKKITIAGTDYFDQQQYMCGVLGTTPNPSTDPNFIRIAGLGTISSAQRTPNTH